MKHVGQKCAEHIKRSKKKAMLSGASRRPCALVKERLRVSGCAKGCVYGANGSLKVAGRKAVGLGDVYACADGALQGSGGGSGTRGQDVGDLRGAVVSNVSRGGIDIKSQECQSGLVFELDRGFVEMLMEEGLRGGV